MCAQNKKNNISILLSVIIWLIATLFFLYAFFLRTAIGSIAHQVIHSLNLNAETFALLGSGYYFAYGIMQIPVGILVDKFGLRKVMISASLTCSLATLMFSQSTTFHTAFAARFLMGLGSSFAFICLLVVIMKRFPKKYFASLAGISQFIGTLGPLLAGGPFIALMYAAHENWHQSIATMGWIGIALTTIIVIFIRNGTTHKKPSSQRTYALKVQLTLLLKNKQAWAIALYSGITYTSIALMGAVWGTEYLQSSGLAQVTAAGMISIAWLGYAVGCPLFGSISDFTKRRKPILLICSAIGLISTLLIVYHTMTENLWITRVVFFGLGLAASGQNVAFATISEHVNAQSRASAFGFINAMITVFDVLTPTIVGFFIYLSAGIQINHLKAFNFKYGLSVMPIFYGIGFLVAAIGIKETFCKPIDKSVTSKST